MSQPDTLTTDTLVASIRQACRWLVDVAQVKEANLADGPGPAHSRFDYADWRGAIRGEYGHADRRWDFFGPIWHTGQAVKALAAASQILSDVSLVEAARFSAEFVLRNRITDPGDEDYGLILAYEDCDDKVNTSGAKESLPGLLELYKMTGEKRYLDAAKAAIDWTVRKAYIPEEHLCRDVYDPKTRQFLDRPYGTIGRPLTEDAVFLIIGQLTGDETLKRIHYEICERLIRDEDPPGNWIAYPPAHAELGTLHPRHAYWWGMPFIDSCLDRGDPRYLQVAIRAGRWYISAQRADGGLIRRTFRDDFKTDSFGHATSGIACAAKMWVRLYQITQDDEWLEPLAKALRFCMMMQMTAPADPNLRGVIVEKIIPPDGTDRSLLHVRDLGTIFYIQAACDVLAANLLERLR